MSAEKPELNSNQEISWRLKELGPELRRALFEKALHPLGPLGSTPRQPRARAQDKPGDLEVKPKKAGKTGGT